jgi:hypothetical protein
MRGQSSELWRAGAPSATRQTGITHVEDAAVGLDGGGFLLKRLGADRYLDRRLMAVQLVLRRRLVDETGARTALEYMLIDDHGSNSARLTANAAPTRSRPLHLGSRRISKMWRFAVARHKPPASHLLGGNRKRGCRNLEVA